MPSRLRVGKRHDAERKHRAHFRRRQRACLSRSVIHDVLAEAARLTAANGYRYFVVLTADDLTRTVTVRYPGRVLHNQPSRTNESFGTFTGRAYATGGSSYMLPDRVEEHIRPAMDIIIRMYRPGEIEPQAAGVWDATAAIGRPTTP